MLVEHPVADLVDAVVLVHLGVGRAERGDLDDLRAEAHVREVEAATDQAAVPEELADLLRMGVRRDVEILGVQAEQQVAHRPADQERLVARVLEPVEDLQRVRGDVGARDGVPGARDDHGLRMTGQVFDLLGTQ